jgi:hypothetical protein
LIGHTSYVGTVFWNKLLKKDWRRDRCDGKMGKKT